MSYINITYRIEIDDKLYKGVTPLHYTGGVNGESIDFIPENSIPFPILDEERNQLPIDKLEEFKELFQDFVRDKYWRFRDYVLEERGEN